MTMSATQVVTEHHVPLGRPGRRRSGGVGSVAHERVA
jgi:hypothetical protein